jgi:sulfoxide reductase heme-binding subunit YedZ
VEPSDPTRVSQPGRTHRGPPLGRHAAAVGLTAGLMLAFSWYGFGTDWASGMSSNIVAADASVVLLCLVLMLGAGARLIPRLRRFAPWRRELGIAVVVTAGLHVLLVLAQNGLAGHKGGLGLDILTVSGLRIETLIGVFFGEQDAPGGLMPADIWDAANWLGLIALGYALVLAATSNDWSQRQLGRGWKFLHIQTYTLFLLVVLHTATYAVFGFYHASLFPAWWLLGITLAVVAAQFAGFVHTVRGPRPPTPHTARRGHRRTHRTPTRAVRWTGVVALWTALVVGTQLLGLVPTSEERAAVRLCERYDLLYGLPYAGDPRRLDPEARDELIDEILPLVVLESPWLANWEGPADSRTRTLERRAAEILQECEDRLRQRPRP